MDDIITVADKKHQKHLEKCRIASAKWRRNNPAKARDALVKWRQNNKDKIRAQQARWRKNNKDKIRAINGRQYQNHKEKIKSSSAKYRQDNPTKCRDTVSRWCENNPGYRAKYKRERRLNDSNFRMIENIRVAMRSALVGKIKTGHTAELLGCSINELREHLERLFQSGMTWNNYGNKGWEIDHIIPLSYFDHSDPEQQKRAWHYTNLQPLWAADNRSKKDKILETQLFLL